MRIESEGLEVTVFRSTIDGKLCVAIDTEDLAENDIHQNDEIPEIRISVNAQDIEIQADGSLKEV